MAAKAQAATVPTAYSAVLMPASPAARTRDQRRASALRQRRRRVVDVRSMAPPRSRARGSGPCPEPVDPTASGRDVGEICGSPRRLWMPSPEHLPGDAEDQRDDAEADERGQE